MSVAASGDSVRKPLSPAALAGLLLAAGLIVAALIALGTWQLERRAWKLDLVARVEQRVHAPAVAAPGPGEWPQVSKARDEYRHVSVTGTFLHARKALVQASTVLGTGYWVMTPLRRADGGLVWINRGFVPSEQSQRPKRGGGEAPDVVTVSGLLRITEPGGGFLRKNDPAANRWYSRDVQAMALARGLREVAPYFIDAVAVPVDGPRDEARPVGGLTVLAFPNNHLVYAITWYVLAAMVAAAAGWIVLEEMRLRRGAAGAALHRRRGVPHGPAAF